MIHRVGFIGCGFIGKVHAHAYRSLPAYYDRLPLDFRLATVATSRNETSERARDAFGFEAATTDWREVIDDPSITIVHIAQPNAFHRDTLLAAMAAGKHIYCEKPLTATWAEALDVHRALPRYSGVSQMCVQNRFFAAMLEADRLVREGLLGEVLALRAAYLHSGIVDPAKPLNWKATVEYGGGGVINDLGPHVIDLVELLAGPIDSVLAVTRTTFADREVRVAGRQDGAPSAEDHAVALLRLEGGATGSVEVSKVATGTQDELRIEVHGTTGALAFDLMEPHWLRVFDQRRPEMGWSRRPTGGHYRDTGAIPGKMATGWIRGHVASLHHFLSAVGRGEPTRPDLADGVRVQAVLDAAYRSSAAGAWCPVATPTDG